MEGTWYPRDEFVVRVDQVGDMVDVLLLQLHI